MLARLSRRVRIAILPVKQFLRPAFTFTIFVHAIMRQNSAITYLTGVLEVIALTFAHCTCVPPSKDEKADVDRLSYYVLLATVWRLVVSDILPY